MKIKKIILTILILMVAAFIFYNSSRPATESSQMSGGVIQLILSTLGINLSQFLVRKAAHFMEFAVFGGLTSGLFRWKAVIICSLYAVSDEIHQYFVPGRSCELRDCIIDICGVVTGVVVIWVAGKIINRNRGEIEKTG